MTSQHRHIPVKTQHGDSMCATCRKILSPVYEKRRRTRIIHNYRKLAQSLRIQANEVEAAFGHKALHIQEFADRLEQEATTVRQGNRAGGPR